MAKLGRVLKYILFTVMYAILAFLILRCCQAADRTTFADLIPTDALCAAYQTHDSAIVVHTHDVVREVSENGYMALYGYQYFPEASEVQVTVRYNKSIYNYTDVPAESEFTYVLLDSESGERIAPSLIASHTESLYRYRRLVFDGVKFSETSDLTVIMYYGDTEISRDTIHYADQNAVTLIRSLTKAEKKLLAAAIDK